MGDFGGGEGEVKMGMCVGVGVVWALWVSLCDDGYGLRVRMCYATVLVVLRV